MSLATILMQEFLEWAEDYIKINTPLQHNDADYQDVISKLDGGYMDSLFRSYVLEYYGKEMLKLYDEGRLED